MSKAVASSLINASGDGRGAQGPNEDEQIATFLTQLQTKELHTFDWTDHDVYIIYRSRSIDHLQTTIYKSSTDHDLYII